VHSWNQNWEIGVEMNLTSAFKSEGSLVDVAGIEPANPRLQSTRLDSTDSIHRYQLLTFPTNWGICFALQANPNRMKTLDSCTVRSQSPNMGLVVVDWSDRTRKAKLSFYILFTY
jgi:hypothetical protein